MKNAGRAEMFRPLPVDKAVESVGTGGPSDSAWPSKLATGPVDHPSCRLIKSKHGKGFSVHQSRFFGIAVLALSVFLAEGGEMAVAQSSSADKTEASHLPAISASKIPAQAFVGQDIAIDVTPLGNVNDYEYRFMMRTAESDWNFDAPWSTSPKFLFSITEAGSLSFHAQVRRKEDQKIVFDKWLGQTVVYEKRSMSDLVSAPLTLITTYTMPRIYASLEAERKEWRNSISSFADLAKHVNERFANAKLNDLDGMFSHEDVRRGVYYMAFVSGLWAYGNKNNPDLPGCVAGNEVTGALPPRSMTIRTFLDAPIGCCTDYTTILAVLLTSANIDNRIVEVFDNERSALPNHVFNEAFLGGRWWTLDANINVAYAGSWKDVSDFSLTIEAFLLPHSNMRYGSANYRESVGAFRTFMLTSAANGYYSKHEYHTPEAWFSKQDLGENLLQAVRRSDG